MIKNGRSGDRMGRLVRVAVISKRALDMVTKRWSKVAKERRGGQK